MRSLSFAGSTVALAGSIAMMEAGERALTTGVFVLLVVVVAIWLGAAWSALGSWLSPPAAPQAASPGR